MKKKKEKTYIFVDSENIGNLIPENIDRNTKVFFYYSNANILKSIEPMIQEKRFEMININQGDQLVKNEMDLCIIASLASRLYKKACKNKLDNCRFVILSNDKGYDKAIAILKKTFSFDKIERTGMSLRKFIDETPDPYEELPITKGDLPKDKNLRKKAKKERTWQAFKQSLSPSEKKSLRIQYARNSCSSPVWFEYDFYSNQYLLMYSGTMVSRFASLEQGDREYKRLMALKPKPRTVQATPPALPAANKAAAKPRGKSKKPNRSQRRRKAPANDNAPAAKPAASMPLN